MNERFNFEECDQQVASSARRLSELRQRCERVVSSEQEAQLIENVFAETDRLRQLLITTLEVALVQNERLLATQEETKAERLRAQVAKEERNQLAQQLQLITMRIDALPHEVNNQLTVITGKIQLLLRSPDLSESDRERIVKVEQAVNKVMHMLKPLGELRDIKDRGTAA